MPDQPPARRTTLRATLEAVHALAAGVWLAGATLGGVTASVAFPAMRTLDPVLGAYPAYDPDGHADLAAGVVANRVFLVGDVAMFAAAVLAVLATGVLIALGGLPLRRWSSGVRLLALGGALLALAYQVLVLGPRMGGQHAAYLDAAAAGDNDAAAALLDAFMSNHESARLVFGGIVLGVLTLVGSGAFNASSRPDTDDAS